MKLTDLEDTWVNKTHESIKNIRELLNLPEEYNNGFVELAKFILETDINPYEFLPSGWCNSLGSAQTAELLLHCIHHALVDDGDICVVYSNEFYPPFLEFCDRWDTDKIEKIVERRNGSYNKEYTVENYSSKFIPALLKNVKERKIRREKFEERRKKL